MNFIDSVLDFAASAWDKLNSSGVVSSLITTALAFWGVSALSDQTNPTNTTPDQTTTPAPDYGVRLQVDPDASHKIPVVYGQAFLGGIITDAQVSNNNQTMTYCITLCESTGVKMSDGIQSVITPLDVYWNDQRVVFNSDGVTVNYTTDREGLADFSLSGLVKIWFYTGNSQSQSAFPTFTLSYAPAWQHMPGWTSAFEMNDLVFAIVEVNYNKEKNVTGLGDLVFHIKNNMTLPGDCIYDYMTNTRYGAGIDPTEIYSV